MGGGGASGQGAGGTNGGAGSGATAGSGGASGAGGGSGGVAGTSAGAAGKGGSAGAMSGATCANPRIGQAGFSGSFGTTAAVCYFVDMLGNLAWGCSNLGNRTVSVNGGEPSLTCAFTLPPRVDGGYYFAFSAGSIDYTSFFWYVN